MPICISLLIYEYLTDLLLLTNLLSFEIYSTFKITKHKAKKTDQVSQNYLNLPIMRLTLALNGFPEDLRKDAT